MENCVCVGGGLLVTKPLPVSKKFPTTDSVFSFYLTLLHSPYEKESQEEEIYSSDCSTKSKPPKATFCNVTTIFPQSILGIIMSWMLKKNITIYSQNSASILCLYLNQKVSKTISLLFYILRNLALLLVSLSVITLFIYVLKIYVLVVYWWYCHWNISMQQAKNSVQHICSTNYVVENSWKGKHT